MNVNNIAIMGMGYVGLTLSVVLAKKGFKVLGVEIDKEVVENLKNGIPHFQEKGLKSVLVNEQKRRLLVITDKLGDEDVDAYFISVGTPLLKDEKKPNVDYIKNVLIDVGKHMKKGALVILRSTVPVGLSRNYAIPILEEHSKLKSGEDFSFVFAPERTIEGKALIELETNPQIIGGIDDKSVELASEIFRKMTHTLIVVENIESAEMVKLMDNSYRDVRFAFSNDIAMICETLNLDASELIKAANTHYPRNNIPIPSPGVGGACLSKDPYILYDFSKNAGYAPELVKESRKINESITLEIAKRIKNKLSDLGKKIEDAKVFIVGFAFKGQPETSDLRDSTTLWFLNDIRKLGAKNLYGYDKVVENKELEKFDIKVCETIEEGYKDADAILFMNNHLFYLDLDPYEIISKMNKPCIFYDSWRMFEKSLFKDNKEVYYMGVGL